MEHLNSCLRATEKTEGMTELTLMDSGVQSRNGSSLVFCRELHSFKAGGVPRGNGKRRKERDGKKDAAVEAA